MQDQDLEKIRHSSAHILAQAVLRLYPQTRLGIGPATDKGFYYEFDVDFTNTSPKKLLIEIEQEINQIVEEELPFNQVFIPRDEAIDMLHQQGQIYKSELLQQISDPEISFYKTGEEFIDLCRGPHLLDTGKVGGIMLKSIQRVHWLNDESRPQLWRIIGIAFKTKEELIKYQQNLEGLKVRDHRKTGQDLAIYSFDNNQGTNVHSLLNHGVKTKNLIIQELAKTIEADDFKQVELKNYWNKTKFFENNLSGYYLPTDIIELKSDHLITNNQLIQALELLLPMLESEYQDTGGQVVKIYFLNEYYKQNPATKNDKGLYELGLSEQVIGYTTFKFSDYKAVLRKQLEYLVSFYRKLFGDNLTAILKIGDLNLLEEAATILIDLKVDLTKLQESNSYNISFLYRDIYERDWLVASLELNDSLNDYLTSSYYSVIKQPNLIGSSEFKLGMFKIVFIENIEAMLALLIEQFAGLLPFAITPYQAIVLPLSQEYNSYARTLTKELQSKGVRCLADFSNRTYKTKLDNALKLKYHYILSVGEQEEKNKVMSVKPASSEELGLMSISEFLQKL